MAMTLLGITGPIGHGKSTFADEIAAIEPSTLHLESSAIISEVVNALHETFATAINPADIEAINNWLDALPDILKQTTHTDCDFGSIRITSEDMQSNPIEYQKLLEHLELLQQQPELARQPITPENKPVYRPILQWVGGYLVRRIGPGIWYDEIVRRAQQASEQGTKIAVAGGVRYPNEADIIRNAGGKVIKIYRPSLDEQDTTDPTERERNNITVDITVVNNGSLEELMQVARTILSDLASGELKPEYRAHTAN